MKLLILPLALALALATLPAAAQSKGEPGKFDFYLLNLVPAAEFCHIGDVGPTCTPPRNGFVLHGLWPQRNNGTYPVFCADLPGPAHPARNLDLTPDLVLLDHEWKKHGTCTTLPPDRFFAAGRKAFHTLKVPPNIQHPDHALTLKPAEVLALFGKINPGFPPDSLILWCSDHRLTSVSACLSKDLKPIACQGVKTCADATVTIAP